MTTVGSTTRVSDSAADKRRSTRRLVGSGIERWALPGVFILTIVFFTLVRPGAFNTVSNARSITQSAAPLLIVLGGLCVVLAMREFDLSFGFIVGACGALAVKAMSEWNTPVIVAIVMGVALGTILGAFNGLLVGYYRVPSFIGTLATGSIFAGLMFAISSETIYEGIPESYQNLTVDTLLGVPWDIWAIGLILLVIGLVLRFSVFGRHAAAIGDNPEAARIAGVNIRRTKLLGFTLLGACAGVGGVVVTATAGQYYIDPGSALVLAGYAAAFLSLSLGRGWRFNVGGAVLGALFLASVETGVTMLNKPTWLAQLLQGLVLLVAVISMTRRRVRQ